MSVELSRIEQLIAKGVIRVGITREDLFSILGLPDDEGGTSRKYSFPCIYKFGDVQFVFPPSRSAIESKTEGLEYCYIDDDTSPKFLLQRVNEPS